MNRHPSIARRRGTVLLLVLWMLILLGAVGMSYVGSVRTEVDGMRATRGRVEALWAARAGVERARLALSKAQPADVVAGGKLLTDEEAYANQPIGPARYSLIVPNPDPQATPVYGLVDEASRVNLNTADEAALAKLPGITTAMIDCLIDWRDTDKTPREEGAEDEYYAKLEHPYPPRNGPLVSLRELLRVCEWGPVFRQVWPDPYERFSGKSARPQPSELSLEDARKLMPMLTVWSAGDGKAPDGQDRMDLGSVSADEMVRRISGLQQDEAQAIEAWRKGNSFQQPADLLNVTRAVANADGQNQNSGGGDRNPPRTGRRGDGGSGGGGSRRASRRRNSEATGEKIFDLQRVGQMIDFFSAGSQDQGQGRAAGQNQAGAQGGKQEGAAGEEGLVNLNTAPRDVLLTVPGMTEALADAIASQRAAGVFTGAGGIATLNGVDEDLFRQLYPRLTARSSRFHVWSRGIEPDSKATVTIEAVLALAEGGKTSIVYWRED